MAAPLKWFPFYIDEWETDERVDSLTLEEQGAYLCLLRWQWREGSISGRPADVAAKLTVRSARAQQPHSHRMAIAKRLLKLFFTPTGDGDGRAVNAKLAELYAAQVGKSEKARQAALHSHSVRSANAERSQDVRTADAGRSRSRMRSEIQQSLSAHAEDPQHNGGAGQGPRGVLPRVGRVGSTQKAV
jgi:uncharacterized protein YdaU (DUF1376 family)